jgi:branched-chain amino acid transport system ATP-binding protein
VGRAGVARTFQGVRLFGRLTVAENVEAAGLGGGLGRRAARRLADEVIERFGLSYTRDVEARSLPYGVERRVALARSVAMRPRFLLLDEPAAGLDEAETTALLGQLRELRGWLEMGLLVIEHDMTLIMRLCERIQVLDHGRTLAVGTPEEVRTDAAVIEAYLGSARDAAR